MVAKSRGEYNAYMRVELAKKYIRRKTAALAHLGGKCVRCGAIEGLEFDHIDPATKLFTIARIWIASPIKFWDELNKCQLLCKDCHRLKTWASIGKKPAKGTHGTLSACRYCKCELCRAVKSAWNREYKSRRKTRKKKDPGIQLVRPVGGIS